MQETFETVEQMVKQATVRVQELRATQKRTHDVTKDTLKIASQKEGKKSPLV
jgi:predicted site-specific integrase-resolvase